MARRACLCPYCGASNMGYYKGTCPKCPPGQTLETSHFAPAQKTMLIRMYTTDNGHGNWYVEMPEDDYQFLLALEHKYGSLSCQNNVKHDAPELLDRYIDLIRKYVNGDVKYADGPKSLCVYG